MYRPIWSAEILAETYRTMTGRLGLSEEKAQHRVNMMESWFTDASARGYEHLIPSMTNHEKDRHVLAAAVRQRAEVIVTSNTRDFPQSALDPFGIKALTPDEFLLDQLDLYESGTLGILDCIVAEYQNPTIEMIDLLRTMRARDLGEFATQVAKLHGLDCLDL